MADICNVRMTGNGFTFTCNRAKAHPGDHVEKLRYKPTEGHPSPWIETRWTEEDQRKFGIEA